MELRQLKAWVGHELASSNEEIRDLVKQLRGLGVKRCNIAAIYDNTGDDGMIHQEVIAPIIAGTDPGEIDDAIAFFTARLSMKAACSWAATYIFSEEVIKERDPEKITAEVIEEMDQRFGITAGLIRVDYWEPEED
jgi:hypothetical protein